MPNLKPSNNVDFIRQQLIKGVASK